MKSSKFSEEGQKKRNKLHTMARQDSTMAIRLLQEQQPTSSGQRPAIGITTGCHQLRRVAVAMLTAIARLPVSLVFMARF